MASRSKGGTTPQKRYEKLLADPKHRPRKKADKRRYDVLLNLVALAGLLYVGSYLVPQKDKQEIAGILGDLPAELTGAARQTAGDLQIANLSGVFSSFMPAILASSKPSPPADAARGEQRSAIVGGPISMGDFPPARDGWQRIEFADARAAAEALQRIDGSLGGAPAPVAPVDALQDRKAVIYDDGARLRFVIVLEIRQPDAPTAIAAGAGPAPEVMTDMPGALSPPRPERSVADVPAAPPSQGLIARARIEQVSATDGPRTVRLAGIAFTDHAADPARDQVDLRASLPGNRRIHVRGRASLAVIEDFLSRADLAKIGLDS